MEDFEKKIKESKEVIEPSKLNSSNEIYALAKETPKAKRSFKETFNFRFVLKLAILLLFVGLVFGSGVFVSNAIREKNNNKKEIHTNEKGEVIVNRVVNENQNTPVSFGSFSTQEELINYLTNNTKTSTVFSNGDDLAEEAEPTSGSPKIYMQDSNGLGWFTVNDIQVKVDTDKLTYKTNTQVDGVDEADIVKVSGNYIFYLAKKYSSQGAHLFILMEDNGELKVLKDFLYEKETEVLKEYDEGDGYELVKVVENTAIDLYVTDRYMIVHKTIYEYRGVRKKTNTSFINGRFDYTYRNCFDVYNLDSPDIDLVQTIETAGSNVSTRLVGNVLYVINNYYDYYYNNNAHYYIPYYMFGDEVFYPVLSSIYYCDDKEINQKSYVSIYKITLDAEITVEDLHIITPSINNVYSTAKNIYLLKTFGNEQVYEDDYYLNYSSTRVVVVNIEEGLSLSGSFNVKGSIGDKYWIDEKDEYIRVVATGTETKYYYFDKQYVYNSVSKVFNQLSIFKKTEDGFTLVGKIDEGLGKIGERIRSARFNGDVVTVVTFRQTDPLYYIDISDPENPVITSALEVTGFSVYQHPYKDNYVIGFGYEANQNGRTTGLKISLFDISNKEVKQVGNSYIIPYSESSEYQSLNSPVFLSDPKALFVNLERDIFGFCLNGWDYTRTNYYLTFYLVFKINLESENPFELIVKEKVDESTNNKTYKYFDRMVFIGTNYYLLSGKQIDIYKYQDETLNKQKTMKLD